LKSSRFSFQKNGSCPSQAISENPRVPKRIVQGMTSNAVWNMAGMSALLGRDTVDGFLACKRRRMESEQQSAADLFRRRQLCAMLAVVIHDIEADRAVVWRRNRLDWDKYLREMRHSHFRSMFRMSYACFLTILVKIGPFLERHLSQSENAGGYISPSMQLGMTLRYCAGGTYLDIHDRYGVSSSSFYSLIFECLEVIVEHYPIVFPTDQAALQELAQGFQKRQHKDMRCFLYALGALDGILLKIRKPTVKQIAQPTLYHCRKGFHALNVQAVCDAHKRFTYCAIDMPGSTHDSRAFANSSLAHAIATGAISEPYYFLGDAAYKGNTGILTPYIGNLHADESVFSFYHSSLRMTIEGSFGMLVNKWGVLQGPIRLAISRAPVVIKACMALHNLIITHDLPNAPPLMPPTRSLSRGNSASTRPWIAGSLTDTECVAQCLRDGDAVTRCRENIKNVMTQLEIKRPTMRTEREKMQADLCDG
jgi:hypothetical protein